jgi:hypothetical protein
LNHRILRTFLIEQATPVTVKSWVRSRFLEEDMLASMYSEFSRLASSGREAQRPRMNPVVLGCGLSESFSRFDPSGHFLSNDSLNPGVLSASAALSSYCPWLLFLAAFPHPIGFVFL